MKVKVWLARNGLIRVHAGYACEKASVTAELNMSAQGSFLAWKTKSKRQKTKDNNIIVVDMSLDPSRSAEADAPATTTLQSGMPLHDQSLTRRRLSPRFSRIAAGDSPLYLAEITPDQR